MFDRLKDRLIIDHWREAWHLWSVRAAAAVGVGVSAIVAAPDVLLNVLNSLPPETRAAISPVVGIALGGAIALIRLWAQRKRPDA